MSRRTASKSPPDSEPLLTPDGLAEYLGVSVQTVYKWNHHGTGPRPLMAGRLPRYRRADVDHWLSENVA